MKMDAPRSPLRSVPIYKGGEITVYQALGIVSELAVNSSIYKKLAVETIIERILHALTQGQTKIFLDDSNRPYGFASWAKLCDDDHQSLLAQYSHSRLDTTNLFRMNKEDGTHLWFFDFLSPFTTPLFMLRMLKSELNVFHNARLLQHDSDNVSIRELW